MLELPFIVYSYILLYKTAKSDGSEFKVNQIIF